MFLCLEAKSVQSYGFLTSSQETITFIFVSDSDGIMIKRKSSKRWSCGTKKRQHLHFFSPENGISIQLAALWTQVPWFHRCKLFKNTHFKKIANGFFQVHCCQGDDQLQPPGIRGVKVRQEEERQTRRGGMKDQKQ